LIFDHFFSHSRRVSASSGLWINHQPMLYCGESSTMTEYEAFYQRAQVYRDRLLRLLNRRMHSGLQSRLDAEDIVSELTVKCPPNVSELLSWPEHRFYGWLQRVALRRLSTEYRKYFGARRRSGRLEGSLAGLMGIDEGFSKLAVEETDPAAAIDRKELAESVRSSMALLSRRDREVLELRFFEDLSAQEVASQLGLSAETCRKREYRAKRHLRRLLLASACL
jgi:RNA polymerase sigma-70 factor (ECF subfamily)